MLSQMTDEELTQELKATAERGKEIFTEILKRKKDKKRDQT